MAHSTTPPRRCQLIRRLKRRHTVCNSIDHFKLGNRILLRLKLCLPRRWWCRRWRRWRRRWWRNNIRYASCSRGRRIIGTVLPKRTKSNTSDQDVNECKPRCHERCQQKSSFQILIQKLTRINSRLNRRKRQPVNRQPENRQADEQATGERAPVCSETLISARVPASPEPGIVFAADRCSVAKFRSPFRSGKASFSLQTGAPSPNSEANGCRRRAKVAKRCRGVGCQPVNEHRSAAKR